MLLRLKPFAAVRTKNTTAKITSQHGVIYSKILSYYGENAAKEYARENEKAISDYEKLIKHNDIPCDFEQKKQCFILLIMQRL